MDGRATLSRTAFLAERRRVGPVRMDTLFAPGYDLGWGRVNPSRRRFAGRLIELTPAGALPEPTGQRACWRR